jgi:hypothetical protein
MHSLERPTLRIPTASLDDSETAFCDKTVKRSLNDHAGFVPCLWSFLLTHHRCRNVLGGIIVLELGVET